MIANIICFIIGFIIGYIIKKGSINIGWNNKIEQKFK